MRPDEAGIGADPASRASFASLEKRAMPAISPISLAAVSTPQPVSASSWGRENGDEAGELALQRVDRARQIADAAQLVARDTDTRGLLGAYQTPAQTLLPGRGDQRAQRDLELRPQIVALLGRALTLFG